MKLADIYSFYIAHWLNGGAFLRRGKMAGTSIKSDYNAIMTKKAIKKVFRIYAITPENYDIAFLDLLRDKMFEECPNVRTTINTMNYPTHINVSSEKFIQQMSKASNRYETYKDVFENQDRTAKITGKTYRLPGGTSIRLTKSRLDEYRQLYSSYDYVFHYSGQGGAMHQTSIFIEAISNSIRDLNKYKEAIFGLVKQLKMDCSEIRGINKAYLMQFGAAVPPPKTLNRKFLPQLLFSDENIAAFSTYKSRGLVSGSGVLFGMDYRTKLPLLVPLFESSSAQVSILAGKTGSGKTYMAFQIALSLIAEGVAISAIDIKGREWIKLAKYVKTKIITLDERNPSFVNILRLDDLHITERNAYELFNVAVRGTVQLLSLIVNLNENEGNISDLEMFLREAVLKLYNMNNISPDNPCSFENTKTLKYQDLMPILEDLKLCSSFTEKQKETAQLARTRINTYLGESGLFSDAFKNEISLNDVLEAPLVIYEFNKNNASMTDTLDVLRIFMVQFLDSKKKSFLKEQKKFIGCFYEELQRCDQFGNLIEYICADVTGSRSNNVLVYLLLNSLKVIQSERAQDISSNITSFIVGNVEDYDTHRIENNFGQKWLATQLQLFNEKKSLYRHCFAVHIDTGLHIYETVSKVILPKDMSEQFKTRDTKNSRGVVDA